MQIPNELIDAFARIRISGEEWQVLWVIMRKNWETMDYIKGSQFEKLTGIPKPNVSRALKRLLGKNVILKGVIKIDNRNVATYGPQKNYGKWIPLSKKTRGIKKGKPPPPKKKTMNADLKRSFDIFWPVYPRKVAKKRALKAWLKIKPDEELVKKIVDAVKAQAKTDQWTRDDGQYVPHPATWLNGEQWNDAIEGKQSEMKW